MIVCKFSKLAAQAIAEDQLHDAMLLAQAGAYIASKMAIGHYSMPALELPFLTFAEQLSVDSEQGGGTGTLHVMTRAYSTGGHTKTVIDHLSENPEKIRNTILMTHQTSRDVPRRLRQAVEQSGGQIFFLNDWRSIRAGDLLGRIGCPGKAMRRAERALLWNTSGLARKCLFLRRLALSHERVILSTHPEDPWPIMAFGHPDFPRPVFLLNHADHRFWLGRSVVDAVLEFRDLGRELSNAKRGRPNSLTLPLLFTPAEPVNAEQRATARRRLRLPENVPIVASVGDSYKYVPIGDCNYPKFVADTLKARETLHYLVIGPSRNAPDWVTIDETVKNRLLLPGPVPNEQLEDWLRAADMYVGSFPIGGIVAVMDAARIALPALYLKTPAFYFRNAGETLEWVCDSIEELREKLQRYIMLPECAALLGKKQRERLLREQGKESWLAALDKVNSWPGEHTVTKEWETENGTSEVEAFFEATLAFSRKSDEAMKGILTARMHKITTKKIRLAAFACLEFD